MEYFVTQILWVLQAEIKEILSILLQDLRFSSAVVHQVRSSSHIF